MQKTRTIRIILAAAFFAASIALLAVGAEKAPLLNVARQAQILPSALASTLGVTLFWLLTSFLCGRIYCSTVCPVGTLQDIAVVLRRKTHRKFRFSLPRRWRYDILILYLICLVVSITTVCAVLEPWSLLANASALANPENATGQWPVLAFGGLTGIFVSLAVLLAIVVSAAISGREFCNTFCPIGTALGSFHEHTLLHVEIDPDKCTGCLRCEDVCSSRCIKVVSRYVDNSRCVRCFDCISVCKDDAIHFQINRNRRPATPLLRKKKKA